MQKDNLATLNDDLPSGKEFCLRIRNKLARM